MKFELTVRERLMLMLILSKTGTGSITQLKAMPGLRQLIAFNDDENKLLKVGDVESADLGYDQAEKVLGVTEFEFNRVQRRIIERQVRSVLKQLSENESLTNAHLDLGMKFIPNSAEFIAQLEQAEVKIAEAMAEAETNAHNKETLQ